MNSERYCRNCDFYFINSLKECPICGQDITKQDKTFENKEVKNREEE